MKKRNSIVILALFLAMISLTACGTKKTYQKEITEAWTKTNQYESASYSYSNSYTNAEGVSTSNSVEGAYNKTEDAWSQISSYGTQGVGRKEEVYSNDGVFIRYNLDGENWEAWGTLESEKPDYATYLTSLFEQKISFENFATIEKEEEDGQYIYTLTYEQSYMEERVEEDLTEAEAYLEVLKTTGTDQEAIETMEAKVENLKLMAGAVGQVFYCVDKEGNLTGIGSRMTMENGSGTAAVLQLWGFGETSFKNYINE